MIIAGGKGKGGNRLQLDYPTGVLVDRCDTVYVADHGNNRIMRWYKDTTSGDILIGGYRPGESPKQINGPEGIRFDQDGNLYVVDGYNHRVQQFKIKIP